MESIKELEKEIEEAKTENVLEYDDSNKWRPMNCLLCGENFTRNGIDRHLNQTHGIIRFDWGIREAKLQTLKEVLEFIKKYKKNYKKDPTLLETSIKDIDITLEELERLITEDSSLGEKDE